MAQIEISATGKDSNSNPREVSVFYDFGDNLEHARTLFSDEVIFTGFIANSKITAQSIIRRCTSRDEPIEQIQATITSWKPGVAIQRTVDPMSLAMSKFGSLTKEEQEAFIESLKSRLAA